MRHNNRDKILKRKRGARRAVLFGIAKSLIAYGKIETTEAKAKAVRPIIERLITCAKIGGLANRRKTAAILGPMMTKKIFENSVEKYSGRFGGYIRILKKNERKSDNAPMAIMELI